MQQLYRQHHSPLHRIDARVKLVFTLAFIILLNLAPAAAWPAYILSYALILSATLLSRVGVGLVHKRALLALPFIIAALPLIFSGPPPRLDLSLFNALHVPLSLPGLERFASIAIRSWLSVQAAVLLAATTRFPDLLSALQNLNIPPIFVAIIGLMWRYLHLIGEEALRMLRARASRSAASLGNRPSGGRLAWRARVTGGMAGSLLLRALERSDRVYAAMLSRGYDGSPPLLEGKPLSRNEALALFCSMLLLIMIYLIALLTGA